MQNRIQKLCSPLVAIICLFTNTSIAHERPVHEQVTRHAESSIFDLGAGYAKFFNLIAPDCARKDAVDALAEGSIREDDRDEDEGGKRSLSHFYDPLTGRGLANFPPDNRVTLGTNSLTWASLLNSPALDVALPIRNTGKYNKWSWQNARDYEWHGLTDAAHANRHTGLTNMFRALGQVVHLLQDTSQPQHVRDEQHLDRFWEGGLFTPWHSPIEKFGEIHLTSLDYRHGVLDWKTAGFTKLEDFWNRHLYNGNAAALTAETANGPKLGLAEWANGNFIGERHIYAEWMVSTHFDFGYRQSVVRETKQPGWYPYPSRDTSTNYKEVKAGAGKGPLTLKDGTVVEGDYISKIGDGISVTHHSRLKYLGAKQAKGVEPGAICTIIKECIDC